MSGIQSPNFARVKVGNYVVTGASGFIGSQIVGELLKKGVPGAQILAVDFVPLNERLCTQGFAARGVNFVDPDKFLELLAASLDPQVIFHMGACSDTEEQREDYFKRLNVDYSKHLWSLCTQKKIPLLYASSAATYGDGETGFSDDEALIPQLQPLNLYGQSKQDFDLFVLGEKAAMRTPPFWAGFKFFNVYGPGEAHKGRQGSVVMHAHKQIHEKKVVRLFKSYRAEIRHGEQKRDFIYVCDVTDCLISFADGQHRSGIYNLGTGFARSFKDLAQNTIQSTGIPADIDYIEMPEALRERYQYFTQATSKNLRAAGYTKAFTNLEEGVKSYVKFLEGKQK